MALSKQFPLPVVERVRFHEDRKDFEVGYVGKRKNTWRSHGALARRIRDLHSVVDVFAHASNRHPLHKADGLGDANAERPAEPSVTERRPLQWAKID
jgi:hypothetical protein